MKTNPNESISPMFIRQVGKEEFRPATPKEIQDGSFLSHQQGLTKREYFASMAMQGLLTRIPKRHGGESDLGTLEAVRIAEESVIMADLLIIELNKEETK